MCLGKQPIKGQDNAIDKTERTGKYSYFRLDFTRASECASPILKSPAN